MAKVCQLTRKGVIVGNHVSHANNKTKRRYKPNLQSHRFLVEKNGGAAHWVKMSVSTQAMRLINRKGIEQVLAESSR